LWLRKKIPIDTREAKEATPPYAQRGERSQKKGSGRCMLRQTRKKLVKAAKVKKGREIAIALPK
jgi:hypothetical protein